MTGQPGRWPLLREGDILRLGGRDYTPGSGELRLRIVHVPANADLLTLQWVRLMGVEINADGTDGRFRALLCRVAAIRENPPQRPGMTP